MEREEESETEAKSGIASEEKKRVLQPLSFFSLAPLFVYLKFWGELGAFFKINLELVGRGMGCRFIFSLSCMRAVQLCTMKNPLHPKLAQWLPLAPLSPLQLLAFGAHGLCFLPWSLSFSLRHTTCFLKPTKYKALLNY